MKTLIYSAIIFLLWFLQPYAQTTILNGVVDNPLRTYNVYAEVKTDTSTSVLKEDLDILKTNLDQYLVTLENQVTSGDTLTGEFGVDVETIAYIKVGVVALSPSGKKPSLMKTTWWKKISAREPKPSKIFIEEK